MPFKIPLVLVDRGARQPVSVAVSRVVVAGLCVFHIHTYIHIWPGKDHSCEPYCLEFTVRHAR